MEHKEYRLAAILYTDIVGFSRMMEKDEIGTIKLMEHHNSLVRNHVTAFSGNIIKTIGDAFLIEFSNATNAVKCAIEVQKELETFNAQKPSMALVLRIGCHLGDIYFYENDALGEGINIASRLQSLCRPGRICMSAEVNNLVSSKIEVPIRPLGVVTLKNITREINAYEVLTNGSAEAPDETPSVAATDKLIPVDLAFKPTPAIPSHAPDYNEIRKQVFAAIKTEGRRLSINEARSRISWKGTEVDLYLEQLAGQGFLIKNGSQAFDAAYNPSYREQDQHQNGQRGRQHYSHESSHGSETFHEMGREIKHAVRSVTREIKNEIDRARTGKKTLSPEQYLERQIKILDEQKKGFASHFTTYLATNAGLAFIYFATTPFGFPWPLIVASSWGIGLVSHWVNVQLKKREILQQQNLPAVSEKQFSLVKTLFRERRSWWGQVSSSIAVSGFLGLLNIITTGLAPFWAIFPIAGMAIGVFARLPGYKTKEQELLGQLAAEGIDTSVFDFKTKLKSLPGRPSSSGSGPLGLEAERLRDRIMTQFKTLKGNHPLGDDFVQVLDNYVRQIKDLSVRSKEIDAILLTIPVGDLSNELSTTKNKLAQTDNARMVPEYEKAVEQLEKQILSHDEMVQEQQVLKQRLSNSVNALRQLDIDLGRMKSMASTTSSESLDALRNRSDELRHYLNDLQAGYREAEAEAKTDQE